MLGLGFYGSRSSGLGYTQKKLTGNHAQANRRPRTKTTFVCRNSVVHILCDILTSG